MPCAPGRSSIALDRVGALDGPPHLTVVSRARPCSAGGGRGAPGEERMRFVRRWMALALVAVGCATGSTDRAGLDKLEHIIVIYAENRSFDHLYGLFPGANGLANATPAQTTQVDHDGQPLPTCPPCGRAPEPDPASRSALPNRPFRDRRAADQPAALGAGAQPRPRYYQNIEQIAGGRNDRFAAISDAGGLVMGYYDGCSLPMWQWAREFTLADNFFMGAFGGSFLNHFWLCARARRWSPPRRRASAPPRRSGGSTAGRIAGFGDAGAAAVSRRRGLARRLCGQHRPAAVSAFGRWAGDTGDLRLADPAATPCLRRA